MELEEMDSDHVINTHEEEPFDKGKVGTSMQSPRGVMKARKSVSFNRGAIGDPETDSSSPPASPRPNNEAKFLHDSTAAAGERPLSSSSPSSPASSPRAKPSLSLFKSRLLRASSGVPADSTANTPKVEGDGAEAGGEGEGSEASPIANTAASPEDKDEDDLPKMTLRDRLLGVAKKTRALEAAENGGPPGDGGTSPTGGRFKLANVVKKFQMVNKLASERKAEQEEDDFMNITAETQEHIDEAKKFKGILADDWWIPFWECLLLVGTLYFEVSVTTNDVFFNWRPELHLPFDAFFSIIFSMDVLLRCVMHDNTVGNPTKKEVFVQYFRKWFFIDLLSAFPFHIVLFLIGNETLHTVLYHLTLLRLLRVFTYFRQVNKEAISASYIKTHYQLVPLILMAFWSIAALHLMVVVRLALISDRRKEDYAYINAIYYVLYTVTTVGYGDVEVITELERIYACFLFIFGTIANAAIIGKLSKIMQAHNIESERKQRMMETLAVLKYFNIPRSLQQEVLAFQSHILAQNVGSSYSQIINGLPDAMRQQIGLYVKIKFVSTVDMFRDADQGCKVALAENLKNVVFAPGQYIIKAGEAGQEMFFMGHGYADVLTPGGDYLATIKKGGFFGEIALLIETKRTASIKALTYCDLFRLDKEDFHKILVEFPNFNEQIQNEIATRKEQIEKQKRERDDTKVQKDSEEKQEKPPDNPGTPSSTKDNSDPLECSHSTRDAPFGRSFAMPALRESVSVSSSMLPGGSERDSVMSTSGGESFQMTNSELVQTLRSLKRRPLPRSRQRRSVIPSPNVEVLDETMRLCKPPNGRSSPRGGVYPHSYSQPISRMSLAEMQDSDLDLGRRSSAGLMSFDAKPRDPFEKLGELGDILLEIQGSVATLETRMTEMEGQNQNTAKQRASRKQTRIDVEGHPADTPHPLLIPNVANESEKRPSVTFEETEEGDG